MPRIDPKQLLTCLSILLSTEGGILSQDEVPRLVNLMTKFSKKLVSKCVYILILKQTDQALVDLFMAEGGWNLIHTWLQDAISCSNWSLVYEILSLLLVTPVDVERLKLNNIPKLVKQLSRHDDAKVQELSLQLVHDWLVIVKGKVRAEEPKHQSIVIDPSQTSQANEVAVVALTHEILNNKLDCGPAEIKEDIRSEQAALANRFYKVTLRDGKQIISRTASVEDSGVNGEAPPAEAGSVIVSEPDPEKSLNDDKAKEEKAKSSEKVSDKSKSKERSSSSKHSSSKHRSSSSSHKSSSRDKDKDRHKSSSTSRRSSSSSSSSKHKKDRDKHRENGCSSSSSKDKTESKERQAESKEKQAEKDKDTLAKLKPQSIDRLGRIPKKTDDKDKNKEVKEPKKPTMSIEVRKNSEDRPKTVKVFNSKRRSTGLEEEPKPPPPRVVKKPPPVIPILPQKRSSPTRDLQPLPPPEKKLKMEIPERPGSIKLIPPKPKPQVLQESDIFMDALTAATAKKEPKKRKRRPSVTKDVPESPSASAEPQTPTSPVSSPIGLKNIAAPNFYQDTLETEEKNTTEKEDLKEESTERATTPIENQEVERMQTDGGLKGVLLYSKKKGPKKSVKFNDGNLTQIKYFELDETERVNVTRNFVDMAKMEMSGERHALQMSRKLSTEDTMEPQTMWRMLYIIDQNEPLIMYGCKSKERDVQFAREKDVPQVFYYDRRLVPDSPQEPIMENHPMKDPINIPLEDSETQEFDKRTSPWPEPKGSPPHVEENIPPPVFPTMPMPFQNFQHGAPPTFHQNMAPRFGPPGGPGVFGGPPNMMGPPNGNMMGPPPNMIPPAEMMHQGPPANPHAYGPPDNFNPMMNDNNNYQMPFNPPPNMGMYPPNNFNMNRGGNRGGFRRGGNNNSGPWIRMNGPGPGPGNWNNRGGGGNRGGRLCKNVKNHGFCRNMDKCPFIHPK